MSDKVEEGVSQDPGSREASVLVVDDEPGLADLYGDVLESRYDVEVVYGGREALEAIDDSLDVVLLDRRMPEVTGDEVLEEIEARNVDCRVAMVTAVDPDFDIIDMPFDDYLVEPVTADDLTSAVERLLLLEEYQQLQVELRSLRVKRNVLSEELRDAQFEESEEFARLQDRIESLEIELERIEVELDDGYLTARPPA